MAKEKQPEIVEQIKSVFMESFKERNALPKDADIAEIVNSIKLDSELKRILAVSDRVAYLAKGIISETVRDDAKVVLGDIILLVRAVMSCGANAKSIERTVNNVINVEFGLMLGLLGLQVETKKENVKNTCIEVDLDNPE